MTKQTLYGFLILFAGLVLLCLYVGVQLRPRYVISLGGIAAFKVGFPGLMFGPRRLLHLMLMAAGLIVFVLFSGVIIPDEDLFAWIGVQPA
jgi:hypothetical protein